MMKITTWKWLVENEKSMDEGRRTGAKAEISEELIADCIWQHSFLHSLTRSLTYLSKSYSAVTFTGAGNQKGAREKEEEEQIEKAREATERTPDLRFEILPLCTMEIRAHAQIGSL